MTAASAIEAGALERRASRGRRRSRRCALLALAFVAVLAAVAPATAQGQRIFGNLSPLAGEISGDDFTPNSTVGVEVFDSPGGTLLASHSFSTDGEGIFFGETGTGGLTPGMHIRATDDATATVKELTLVDMSFDMLDPNADTASGTAPPGAQVSLEVFQGPDEIPADTVADGAGAWFVDFGADGVDIGAASGWARVFDGDGDATQADWGAPAFGVSLNLDEIFGHRRNVGGFFTPDASVTVDIFDAPGGTLLFSDTVATGAQQAFGVFSVGPGDHGLDLVPGMHVRVTDDATGIVKELTLVPITFDVLDPVNDVAAGTAPPGQPLGLQIQVANPDGSAETDPVVLGEIAPADANGDWTFVHPDELIEPDMGGIVCAADLDGDCSAADYVPAPHAVEELGDDVDALVADGGLHGGHASALSVALDGAGRHLDAGRVAKAIGELEKFVDRVERLVARGELTAADGQALVDAAEQLITGLGG